ncbi:MAG: hypothetical protein R3A50_18965, partial [Saprospiraceae bacterium]
MPQVYTCFFKCTQGTFSTVQSPWLPADLKSFSKFLTNACIFAADRSQLMTQTEFLDALRER